MTIDDQPEQQREELAELRARVRRLEQHILEHPDAKHFVEHRGVLFKRKPGGGYHSAIYCPRCGFAMGRFNDGLYLCSHCKQPFDTDGLSVSRLITEIEKK